MATKKVIASERGYYGGRIREEGDIFEVPVDEEKSSWFSDFKPKKPAKQEDDLV